MNRRHFLALSAAAATATRASAEASAVAAPILSFGLTTDVQYADADPVGERHYRLSLPKLKAAAADLSKQNLPFTLHLGDVIDREFSSFASVMPLFSEFGHPVHHLLGNHDYNLPDALKSKVVSTLGMPQDYYSFTASGVRFIMLDTNGLSTYKTPKGSTTELAAEAMLAELEASHAPNAKPWNGGVDPAQLAWFKLELASAAVAKQPVIVCGHHPLFPETGHQAWNNREIFDTFRPYPNVRAYLCGHNHAGDQVIREGIPCINFKSILHEPEVTAYAILRLHPDRLMIEGRGREESREIELRKM